MLYLRYHALSVLIESTLGVDSGENFTVRNCVFLVCAR